MAIVSLARYATDAAASFPSMVIRRLVPMSVSRPVGSLGCFYLFVAELAVGADRGPVSRHVRVVMAAEAAGRRNVALQIGIRAEGDHHGWKHVATVHALNGGNAPGDSLLIRGTALRREEVAQPAFDGTHRLVLARIRRFDEANPFAPDEWEVATH